MHPGRLAPLLVAGALLLGACSDDGGDDAGDVASDSGCPVEPGQVGELLGYEVAVVEDTASAGACRYEPVDPEPEDDDAPSRAGAHVLVVERRIAEDGFPAIRDAVEVDVGPTEAMADGVVEGGAGFVARVGRVVQAAVARDRRLVQVTVADPTLDPDDATAVATDLALAALP